MAQEKTVEMLYVKNTGSSAIRVPNIKVGMEGKKDILKTFTFDYERFDRMGVQISSGYTPINSEELKMVKAQSKIMESFIDNKTLVVSEGIPDEALSEAARIAKLETIVTELEGKIGTAEADARKGVQEEINGLLAKRDELQAANEQLTKNLEELTAEFEEYKKEFPKAPAQE